MKDKIDGGEGTLQNWDKKSTSWDPGARTRVVMVREYLGPCVPSPQAALPGRSHPNPELHIVLVLQHLCLLALLLCTDATLTPAKLGSKEGSLSGG